MVDHKRALLSRKIFVLLFILLLLCDASARDNWQAIDRKAANKVFQLNIGLKMRLDKYFYVQVADISSKGHYYVFTTSTQDRGYQVVGRGSAFPFYIDKKQQVYFVTNNHVLDNAKQMKDECEMFYSAVAFYAARVAPLDKSYFEKILMIINLAAKKNATQSEKELYQNTVNSIWDCYDNFLSKEADPGQALFNKYRKFVPIVANTNYFLHAPGLAGQPAIEAKLYKKARDKESDLAVLVAILPSMIKNGNDKCLQLDNKGPVVSEEIHVLGYPAIRNQKTMQEKYNSPTIISGKITKVVAHKFEFDAQITKGNSGGPVVDQEGKVLGVVTNRVLNKEGTLLPNYGGAICIGDLKTFVPELFGR